MGKRKKKAYDPVEEVMQCRKCGLAKTRRHVAACRIIGSTPAKVLIIGAAPSRSDDLKGRAFAGPDGKLMEYLLREAGAPSSILLVNSVCCIPCESRGGEEREATAAEVLTCRANIAALIRELSAPQLVFFLGPIAERFWRKEYPKGVTLRNPADLLKTGGNASPGYPGQVRLLESMFAALSEPRPGRIAT